MGFFDDTFKAITRTALLPLDIASDTVRAVRFKWQPACREKKTP